MTADEVFRVCGMLAVLGWICLLTAPLWPNRSRDRLPRLVGAIWVPAAIAVIYTTLIAMHWADHRGGLTRWTMS